MIPDLVATLIALALLMLAARRRAAVSVSFTSYLTTCLVVNRLITWWPETFHNYEFWLLKESLYSALKLAVLLELVLCLLEAFPRASRMALGAVVVIACAGAAALSTGHRIPDVIAVAQSGAVWGFAALLGVTLWFRLPLHPLNRAIMTGFALYLGAYGAALGLVRYLSPDALPYLSALDSAAYAATLGLWLRAAVQPYQGEPAWPIPRFLWRSEA
jgi:hypothetical protein